LSGIPDAIAAFYMFGLPVSLLRRRRLTVCVAEAAAERRELVGAAAADAEQMAAS
jgi:hypothetical protein